MDLLKRKIQPPAWLDGLVMPMAILFVAALALPLLPAFRRRTRRDRFKRSLRNLRSLRNPGLIRKVKLTRFRDQLRLAWTMGKLAARGKPGVYVVS